MEKTKKVKTAKLHLMLYPIMFFLATLFISIGYASINNITVGVSGKATATMQDGVYITEVNYISNVNADINSSTINSFLATTMSSTIKLSDTDVNSNIVYEVTIYNNSNEAFVFDGVVYDNNFYDNDSITYELNGISKEDILESKNSITFKIIFKYKTTTIPDKTTLNSYLNFKFVSNNSTIKQLKRTIEKQLESMTIGMQNAETGLDFAFAGDEAMNEIAGMLQRINELLIKMYNDESIDEEEKNQIKEEIQTLINEINRVADETEFSGIKLLNGSVNEQNPYIVELGNGDFEQDSIKFVLFRCKWIDLWGSEEINYDDTVENTITKIQQAINKAGMLRVELGRKSDCIFRALDYLGNMSQDNVDLYKYIFEGENITTEESIRRAKSWKTTRYLCSSASRECDHIISTLQRIDELLAYSNEYIDMGESVSEFQIMNEELIASIERELQFYEVGTIKLFDGSFPYIGKTNIDTLNIRDISMISKEKIAESKIKIQSAIAEVESIKATLEGKYTELEAKENQEADKGYALDV